MADDVDVEEICPSIDILTNIETGIPCYVQGCSKILFNTASLRMHVVKTHNVAASDEEKQLFTRRSSPSKKCVKKIFYCPIIDCTRGKSSKKPFPRLGQVKQHYMTVHADKKYVCCKCNRGFGIEAACKRHEAKCGHMFPCSCGCPFTTREALLMHARRKQHEIPVSESPLTSKNSKKANSTNSSAIQPVKALVLSTSVICQPIKTIPVVVQRYCNILPKPTTRAVTNTHNLPQSTSKKDSSTQTSLYIPETGIHTASTQTVFDIASCMDSHLLGAINHSSVGTQVNPTGVRSSTVSSMIDFGSQVMVPGVCGSVSDSSSVGTQHDGDVYINRLNNPTCLSLSSQTLLSGDDLQIPDPQFLNSSETQTHNFDHVSLEDNAAQTLISIFDMDPSCSADCGTQTQRMFDEILSQSDVELTESQTQTWLSSMIPSNSMITDNHDFNNRSALEELVNIETQTSLVMNDLSFDVGLINTETQTIPESFGSNYWSYEPNGRQTQMTQTNAGILYSPFDSSNTSLMDTYTQTFLGDAGSLSNVQTQT